MSRIHKAAAIGVSTVAALGATVALSGPASAAANTLELCVQVGNSGSIDVKPHDFTPGVGSPVVSGGCWSTSFDTNGWSFIDVYFNGNYWYSTSWNSNNGPDVIYLGY